MRRRLLLAALLLPCLPCLPLPLAAAGLPCKPCAGALLPHAETAAAAAALRQQSGLKPGSPLFVAWEVALAPDATAGTSDSGGAPAAEIAQAGGTPWLALVFTTPAPLTTNAGRLQGELQAAAALAAAAPAGTFFQVVWRPEGPEEKTTGAGAAHDPVEYGFLLKRAAVALTGARPDGRVASEPLPPSADAVKALYGQDVAAYLEALVLAPGTQEEVTAAIAAVNEADPGRTVVLDAVDVPADPQEVVTEAARWAVAGVDLTLFRLPETQPAVPVTPETQTAAPATPGLPETQSPPAITAATLAPFALLAREFAGDLSYDPYSVPTGAAEAWSFVRGKDLALRVIARVAPPPGGTEQGDLALHFADASLRRPIRFPFAAGRVVPPSGRVTPNGLDLIVPQPGRVAVLGLERQSAEEREGVAEKVTVSGEREVQVEEILRRLQAFEDAQGRRLDHFQATNTTHLRFQLGPSAQAFEAALEGPYFSSQEGVDWAWENLYLNGVRWRAKTIPEIPLVQPEKAAALPLEIHFTREYRYRLRGSERLEDPQAFGPGGRDAWVIDFAPALGVTTGKLYQGTVWVDKETSARLRTRAIQLGLEGEVISNEETLHYRPVDAAGQPLAWSAAGSGFVLPLRLVGQQILSVVNSTTVVERETVLSALTINGPGFAEAKQKVAASEATMVRDTPQKGLRYLVKDASGERVVKEGFDTSKLFALGGVFYDDSLDYPLPLAGLNYFSFDFKGTGKQVNVFFAGALLTANVAEPRLFGSRFDLGAQAFALAVPFADILFRDDREVHEEEIKSRAATFSLKLGRPLGSFVKLNLEGGLLFNKYSRSDTTASDFVLPSDNVLGSLSLSARYARSGYQLSAEGSYNRRSKWELWGRPGSSDFDPDAKDFLRWEAKASKNWYLPLFQKIGAELDYASGSDLDRFSKYQFGFFGGTRVHGYQSDRVRAAEAFSGHLSYGFEINEALRLEAVVDGALATDDDTGLEREKLGGVGLAGSFVGPWKTLINLDVGVPVVGPDDGFVAYLVFLKLFR